MHSVVETVPYLADAERLFSAEERAAIVDMVSSDPRCGVVVPGTGGVRKVRVAASGRGKSGGARVIYFFGGDGVPMFLLAVFEERKRQFKPGGMQRPQEIDRGALQNHRGER